MDCCVFVYVHARMPARGERLYAARYISRGAGGDDGGRTKDPTNTRTDSLSSMRDPPPLAQVLWLPRQESVDFRAACFCHRRAVEQVGR